jgi:hypothetical protein
VICRPRIAANIGAVERLAYRGVGVANLHPTGAVLNLPVEKYSHAAGPSIPETPRRLAHRVPVRKAQTDVPEWKRHDNGRWVLGDVGRQPETRPAPSTGGARAT